MRLRLGDVGDAVRTLQRGLNKFGAMLLVDGWFGTDTADAIPVVRAAVGQPGPPEGDEGLLDAVAAAPDPFPILTASGVTFIAREEVTSATAYRRRYQTPCWPSATSGITIGIGYDCQFVTPGQFRDDWGTVLPAAVVERLLPVLGCVGSFERLGEVKSVVVPLHAAIAVFAKRSVHGCLDSTRGIYPQVDALAPPRRTALLSLVYNRGTRLTDRNPALQERREMRTIRDLLAAGRLDEVADQFESMTRLWDPAKLGGLIARRRAEATLWRSGFAALKLE